MLSWSAKRKTLYTLAFVAGVLLFIAAPTAYVVYRPPTCTDGKMNQGEQGADCGGPCTNLCQEKELDPIVLWQRSFEVGPGAYNVIAYIQNPNVNSSAIQVPYIFRLYSADQVLISERTGKVNLPPNMSFPVFEANLPTGKQVPARASFEFRAKPYWVRQPRVFPDVRVNNVVLSREDANPLLNAEIENKELITYDRVPVVAILYDVAGNAVAASRTILDSIEGQSTQPVVFTWPKPFGVSISEKEIVPILMQADR
ncbi:MAG: hypothetical protein WCO79_03465 [bacterium]